MRIMLTFKSSPAHTAALSAPDPAAGHCLTYASTGESWTLTESLDQSLVGSLLLSPGSWCTQGSVCTLQESVSPVLCKFWQLYGGVNGLCPTQVYCTQSPCPCSSPLLPVPPQETLKHSSVSVSVGGLWVLVHTRYV